MNDSVFAFCDGRLVADLDAVKIYSTFPIKWRSGAKHDCSRVMELHLKDRDNFGNGPGEVVNLKPT